MPCALRSRQLASATGAAAAFAVCVWSWEKFVLVGTVAKYSFLVFLVDRLPYSVRRKVLMREYSGDLLEKRLTQCIFKGLPTVRALWRMSSINLRPRVRPGDPAPLTPVLLDGKLVSLPGIATGRRPLLLNFGSCT